MKQCTKCKEVKELSEFSKQKVNKDGLQGSCKKCVAIRIRNYYRTKEGRLKCIYDHQIQSSKKRGHERPAYTRQEFIDKYIDNKEYLSLYSKWVSSGYDKMLSPSFDRLDDYKPYSFDNLNKWMTWQENKNKSHLDTKEGRLNKNSKAVIGVNIETGCVIEFYSTREAGRNGFHQSTVGSCCRGKLKHHKGYTWKYKS